MSSRPKLKRKDASCRLAAAYPISTATSRPASIFHNSANQTIALPQELRLPEEVKEVRIRKEGDSLVLSPLRPHWVSIFALKLDVCDDFVADRGDWPPQEHQPL